MACIKYCSVVVPIQAFLVLPNVGNVTTAKRNAILLTS